MNELELKKGIPVLVTPAGAFTVVQNSMTTTDDMLYVSKSGVMSEKWMEVVPGGSVKFAEPLFIMQDSWTTIVVPVIEGA
jgi:hypothetical protein